jgi:hypothetical protein
MGLEMLHGQRLVRVLKELAVFALVYNLVRVVMLAAARRQGVALERIRFVDAVRWLSTARPADPLPPLVVNPTDRTVSSLAPLNAGRSRTHFS